jgi:hypothetical protein
MFNQEVFETQIVSDIQRLCALDVEPLNVEPIENVCSLLGVKLDFTKFNDSKSALTKSILDETYGPADSRQKLARIYEILKNASVSGVRYGELYITTYRLGLFVDWNV